MDAETWRHEDLRPEIQLLLNHTFVTVHTLAKGKDGYM